ncbi:TetR family transcriptional regulator [Corynebacterium epidermidicanis]|uniref:Transcriptional regulator, TetR family n=1 Tax=Corynebacterium epidermidicanis TaxID=1050174 RepID=A0A0G3GVB9_9CORY|nr:TetR/AcrR family transcriptional regulator C-terminal domain-containing protein [Corynebacterium epidermidicanis]AKK03483.1 transcriptional regulator, TetR family [Corynebacterium epidermidicanis]
MTREVIVDEAMSILGEFGLGDLTMRRLARQLEVVPGALYWHVPNKQSLLEAIAERIVAPVLPNSEVRDFEAKTAAPHWRTALTSRAMQLRQTILSNRDGAEVLVAALPVGDLRDRLISALSSGLAESGLSEQQQELLAHTLLDFILGHTLSEQATVQLAQATEEAFTPESAMELRAQERFSAGLDLLLAGVSQQSPLQ